MKVKSFGIQSDSNLTVDAAEGINHVLQMYDSRDHRIQLENYDSDDAGGGGTRKDLVDKRQLLDRVLNYEEYIHTMCALYGLNLTFLSPTILNMEAGGLLKRNMLQCLHTACNLLQQYHTQE